VNRSKFAKVMIVSQVYCFFDSHCTSGYALRGPRSASATVAYSRL